MFYRSFLTLILSFYILTHSPASAQNTLQDYLPEDVSYDPNVPTPASVIGHEVGEWHVTHDKLVRYMHVLADASDRVTLEEIGTTYEGRSLLLVTITAPANQNRIEQIRENQRLLADPSRSDNLDLSTMPVVVNLGYSVHGNEPSGSNASMVVAYYLAAAQGPEINDMLQNSVILIDPSLNPDGLNRFASWVNMHKSKTRVTDPASREFSEVWPGGRTNHYWFDLNRDWLPAQHPSSRARVAQYHRWKPNVLGDFHEMSTHTTYFFQPGIPSRTHPLTPQQNQELTRKLATYHAEAMEARQELFFTRERFDDFYYGKGSSYPDVQGTVAILYEQASSRGHAQESIYGVKTFPYTIHNQVTTSLSTLQGSLDLRQELHQFMRDFYRNALQEARRDPVKAWIFGDFHDRARTWHMIDMLYPHQIEIHELARDLEIDGQLYRAGEAYLVPNEQPQYRLIRSMFEKRTEFTDSLFYDVSSWTLPYAMNMPHAELRSNRFNTNLLGERLVGPEQPVGRLVGGQSSYSYLFDWDEYYAPRALYRLQQAGVRTLVASAPLRSVTVEGAKDFSYGAIQVPLGIQDKVRSQDIHQLMQQITEEDGVDVYAVQSGLSESGIDLGSHSYLPIDKPVVALVVGRGVSPGEAGEVWHLLDQRVELPLTLLDQQRISTADLSRYNVLVMVSGNYSDLSGSDTEKIRTWVRDGGTLILIRQALNWGKQQELARIVYKEEKHNPDGQTGQYADLANTLGAQVIGGSIFWGILDTSHPIGYGFRESRVSLFRNSTLFLEPIGNNPFATPLLYEEEPLASGYISDRNLDLLRNSAAVVISSHGNGRVIAMADNPNFRAFWFGTNKLFLNAIFFGQTIDRRSAN